MAYYFNGVLSRDNHLRSDGHSARRDSHLDGQRADLDAVTQQVAQGIQSYADAIASGRTAIDDFFSAPVSGFGDGVILRVTLRSGARQVVTLDRWISTTTVYNDGTVPHSHGNSSSAAPSTTFALPDPLLGLISPIN